MSMVNGSCTEQREERERKKERKRERERDEAKLPTLSSFGQ